MNKTQPKRSLKIVFPVWFLLSSLALAFITGVFLSRFKEAINEELQKRLNDNFRVISRLYSDYQVTMAEKGKRMAEDSRLIYYLGQGAGNELASILQVQMRAAIPQAITVFGADGTHITGVFRNESGELVTRHRLRIGLADDLMSQLEEKNSIAGVSYVRGARPSDSMIVVYLTHRVRTKTDATLGFIEQTVELNTTTLKGLKNTFNLELIVFDNKSNILTSSHMDLSEYPADFFRVSTERPGFFELTVRDVPYGFITNTISWGDDKFVVAAGDSKEAAQKKVREVTTVVLATFLILLILLLLSSFLMARVVLKPLLRLVEATRNLDQAQSPLRIPVNSPTELGLLTESFNSMSARIWQTRRELETKVAELQRAYTEIKDTQSKLVHSAKMASLGQLVAGIAHELNNPIGFIYSNMSHLREYGEKLIKIVEEYERLGVDAKAALELKKELDYDYIREDLPKLISSCEEGARRTKDIVLGLRNFSRLDEAVFKPVQINEGLDNTLALLVGETKNRITIKKDYEDLPLVECYASQINQVFMNILTNAAQAIVGEGEIRIRTWSGKNKAGIKGVFIAIADTGVGVDASDVEKIFDPFYTTKKIGDGTGLGLSISYGVIRSHGGEIEVQSERGKGTEFTIFLPLKPPA
jgi:two-component system NtrC family sensor kinase